MLSFSIAEDELRKLSALATWSGTTRPGTISSRSTGLRTESSFEKFKTRYGADRVTSDVIEAAYDSVLPLGASRPRGRVRRGRPTCSRRSGARA